MFGRTLFNLGGKREQMNFGNKIVVALDLQDSSSSHLRRLQDLDLPKGAEVQFVYIYQTAITTYGLGEFCQIYPTDPDRSELELAIVSAMMKRCQDVSGITDNVIYRCLFDENPKEEFCLYAKEVKADTLVVFTRERHGLFDSSFASYAAKHSPCHLIIIKP